VSKRENRRVHLVGYLDDHGRFVVGYALHATASGALVRELLEAAIANYGAPEGGADRRPHPTHRT
jgi:transposase InsO family protein